MEILIEGPTVVDGTGAPPRPGNVGIDGGLIRLVEPGARCLAGRTIDARGLVVAPGFIDIHAHTDFWPSVDPFASSKLFDGVTLEVSGNCGCSAFPLDARSRSREDRLLAPFGARVEWHDFTSYKRHVEHVGTGIHRASLVGHGNLRKLVVGYENRPATDAELAEMGRILGELLDQGALGLSTGLIYPPGCFAGTGELVALAGVAASRGKIYTSHIRGEGRNLLGAIDEVLHIAVEAGVRTQVSHLKASGPANWHKIDEALAKIEAVRSRGFEVMADRYPYTATNTGLDTVFRDWVHEGGSEAMLSRIVDASVRGRILEELGEDYPADRLSRVMISSIPDGPGKELEGRLVTAVARERGLDPHEAVLWILSTCRGEASAIFFSLSEEIMRRVLSLGWVMVATDATAQVAHPPHIEGFPHPRGYGTFSKVLGRFCREERLFPLETAIHKMTGLPARQLGLARRGTVAEGHHADLVVFDPATIRDESTYEAPHHYSSGITHVLVAGRVVLENGHLTGERPGRVLTRER